MGQRCAFHRDNTFRKQEEFTGSFLSAEIGAHVGGGAAQDNHCTRQFGQLYRRTAGVVAGWVLLLVGPLVFLVEHD